MSPPENPLIARARALGLYGLLEHYSEIGGADWVEPLIAWEEAERGARSLERRLAAARLGRFKTLAEFDWHWPTQCDRQAIEALMGLEFIAEAANAILIGPNGVGKTTIARNIAYQGVLAGHTVLATTAAHMLGELAAQDGDNALKRRLNHYVRPALLLIDELGYLSYSNRHADLLFEIVSRRYEHKATLVTTNRPFSEWAEVFPNAPCVVSLIDRLVHHAEIITIDGASYRLKEARERAEHKARQRRAAKSSATPQRNQAHTHR
jgi:DNA replication protein DnaC